MDCIHCIKIAFFQFLIFVYIALYLLKSPQIRCILLIYGTVCMELEYRDKKIYVQKFRYFPAWVVIVSVKMVLGFQLVCLMTTRNWRRTVPLQKTQKGALHLRQNGMFYFCERSGLYLRHTPV